MTSRPPWFRIDTGTFDNPKMVRAIHEGGHGAVVLWLRGLAYSTHHLTDGWVPLPLPRQWGHTKRHIDALETVGLWHPLEITDDGGWLIHDYPEYQITRQEWEAKVQQRRDAIRKRWAK